VTFFLNVTAAATWDAAKQSLAVKVPAGAQSGPVSVPLPTGVLTTNELTITSGGPTTGPTGGGGGTGPTGSVALTVDPPSAAVHQMVAITGADLSSVSSVTFGGGATADAIWDAPMKELSVTIPSNAQTGPISVPLNGSTVLTTELTVVPPPVPLTVEPTTAKVEQMVGIQGTELDGATVTFFGGVEGDATWDGQTRVLSVEVRQGAETGPITVERNGVSMMTNELTVEPKDPDPDED
jgi:hypothetical protein